MTDTQTTDYLEDPYREDADETIAGLKELIVLLIEQPELAHRFGNATLYAFSYTEDEWKRINKMMGTFDKDSTSYDLEATRRFGPLTLKHCITHDKVCEKKVTGTKTVTRREPVEEVEYHDVEVEEEIVEWVCPDTWR